MAAFEYTALNAKGKRERGVLEGDTARQVRQLLRESGLTPLDVHAVSQGRGKAQKGHKARFVGRIKSNDLVLITRQLATLTQAGSPLEESLRTAAKQSDKRNVKRILTAVRSRVVEGHTLAAGLGEYPTVFPELYRATVAAGEQSGHLDTVLDRLADYTETRQAMQQRVTTAMLYPMILSIMAIAVLTGLLGYVVPKVVEVFDNLGQNLPALTQGLIAVSDFVREQGLLMFGAAIVFGFIFKRLLKIPAWRYRYHQFLLKVPLVGKLTQGFNTARFARTLSILAASGVPILQAMKISAQVMQNLPMRQAVEEATVKVREGTSIYKALEQSGYFPPMTVYLIASGESSGQLENMLERAAVQQERETDGMLSTLLGVFEPILILVMGGVVLLIVLAILLPIFELNQLVR